MMTNYRIKILFCSVLLTVLVSGCAYRLGSGSRTMPGGYTQVSVPVFKNKTQETGVEVAFTNAFLSEFLRSKAGRVVDDAMAEVRIEGTITSITYTPESPVTPEATAGKYLPKGTILASRYTIRTYLNMKVIRRSDNEVIWEANFDRERPYAAPQVHMAGVNSVNPLYNLSARRQNLDVVAQELMVEAHSRMTENF